MKTHTMLITAASCAALLAMSSVQAGPWDARPATAGVQGERSAYIGTSLPDPRRRIPDQDRDRSGYAAGTAGPEKGAATNTARCCAT